MRLPPRDRTPAIGNDHLSLILGRGRPGSSSAHTPTAPVDSQESDLTAEPEHGAPPSHVLTARRVLVPSP